MKEDQTEYILYPGMTGLLEDLQKKGIFTAVLSDLPQKQLQRVLQQLQIERSVLPEGAKELEALRELYLAARYGEETDPAAAKEADRLYHALQELFHRR